MADRIERVSLHRIYPRAPFYKWACTVEKDGDSPGGYRVIDQDRTVADSGFLVSLEKHMRSPVEGQFSDRKGGGTVTSGVRTINPGEPEHFGTAARAVPFAHVGPAPARR